MKKILLLLILLPITGYATSEYRTGASLSAKLTEKWTFLLSQEFKWVSDRSGLASYYTDFGTAYTINPSHFADRLSFGISYRQAYYSQQNDVWTEENRPYMSITPSWDLPYNFKFNLSNAIEYRHFSNGNTWRYRIQPFIQHTPTGLFVASKLSYNIASTFPARDSAWDSNELDFGVSRSIHKNISGALWYRLNQVHHSEFGWQQTSDQIGIDIKFSF